MAQKKVKKFLNNQRNVPVISAKYSAEKKVTNKVARSLLNL